MTCARDDAHRATTDPPTSHDTPSTGRGVTRAEP
jgi:hypothetical protein